MMAEEAMFSCPSGERRNSSVSRCGQVIPMPKPTPNKNTPSTKANARTCSGKYKDMVSASAAREIADTAGPACINRVVVSIFLVALLIDPVYLTTGHDNIETAGNKGKTPYMSS